MSGIDKAIVTNRAQLRAKYRTSGLTRIEKAVASLVAADARKGFTTQLIALDDRPTMKALGGKAVRNARSAKQNKEAIDAVYAAHQPDYITILGAPDVIPHQSLINPVGGSGGDGDPNVPSDLPYACDAPFSRDIQDFLGPVRVVSRLPDVDGEDDPAYLLRLLATARSWRSLASSSYAKGLAISADVWKASTRRNARRLFGSSRVELVPPDGPVWPKSRLARWTHLINCHGAQIDPQFYGEDAAGSFPVALRSRSLTGLRKGNVTAAECCYGAELYDPQSIGVEMGLANAYLKRGAYGYVGSTNIAYGPASGNGEADLICQYFLRNVLKGASIGRAMLESRQEYVRKHVPMGPVDLKTLAQFYLLGDASIHPVRRTRGGGRRKGLAGGGGRRKRLAGGGGPGAERASRRRRLVREGHGAAVKAASVNARPDRSAKSARRKSMANVLAKAGMAVSSVRTFEIRSPRPSAQSLAGTKAVHRVRSGAEGAFHVMIESAASGPASAKIRASEARIKTRRLIVTKEVRGKVVEVRELHPR